MYAFLWDHDGINFQNVPFKNEKEAGAGLSPNAQILTCMQFIAEHNGANYLYAQRAGEARQFLECAGLTDLFSGILSPETLSFPLQPAPVKQTETCRPNDLRPSDCMLISDREDRLAAAKLIGVTSCYLAEDVIFRLKDVNSDYYCANSGHLLSLIRYRYAPRAAFRARRTANREYPGCVLFRITEPSCSPSTSSCPYDYESYYAIDVRTGTPLYVSHSARPMGHGYDSDTFVKPVSFDVVQNFADIRADTWRSRIGEARIAEALAKAEKERHAPVPLSPLPKKKIKDPAAADDTALFLSDRYRKAVYMRKKPDGTWLFSLKVYKGFAGFAFCTGHKPLENKAQALLLDPLRYNDYEAYDRRLTRREIAYVNGYCKTHTEAECIDHLFMIAAYGTE